ncbi:lasso peptide biosynthesis B2 protein [Priestia megaterium]
MKFIKKLRNFSRLETSQKLMLLEAFYYLGYGRVFKALPFSKVAPTLGERMKETSFSSNTYDHVVLKNISNSIYMMSKYTFWESQCLVKAVAGMKMLERRHIGGTIYLGTAKDENGKLIAHAWLRSGSIYVTGSEGMEKFTEIGRFSKEFDSKESRKGNNGT